MATRILLADDSITIQKVVELTFSEGDFEVLSVSNGRLALEKLPEWAPDIALLDVIMPERSGYEVCHEIRQDPRFRSLPVLLLTGTFEPFDGERAKTVGANGHITKPFESRTLIARVEELLAASRMEAPAASAAGTEGGARQEAEEALDWVAGDFGQDLPTAADIERGFASRTGNRSRTEVPGEGGPRWSTPPATASAGIGGEPFGPVDANPAPEPRPAPPREPDFGRTMAIEIPPDLPAAYREPDRPRRPGMPAAGPVPEPEPERPVPARESSPPAAPRMLKPGAGGEPPLTPESIDTIARRVVEKLSDQVVREIAWEVVPDLAETLIRKRIQELEEQIGEG